MNIYSWSALVLYGILIIVSHRFKCISFYKHQPFKIRKPLHKYWNTGGVDYQFHLHWYWFSWSLWQWKQYKMFHYNICFNIYIKIPKTACNCILCPVSLKFPFHFLSNEELSDLVYTKQSCPELSGSWR